MSAVPFYDQPIPKRQMRKLLREAKRDNPAFFRAIRKLTDKQLRSLKAELISEELAKLRRLPARYQANPQIQRQRGIYEYELRNLEELEHWSNLKPPRKQIPRRRPNSETPAPAVRPAPMPFFPAEFALVPPEPPKPEPVADNVIPFDSFHSKFFHSSRNDYDVW
jgi:hypothetical protein